MSSKDKIDLENKKILVTGASGMLGTDLLSLLRDSKAQVLATSINDANFIDLDITKAEDVKKTVHEFKPDWIINCAAHTAVDKAEEEEELAELINATGVKNLAEAQKEINGSLLHISTDYVFGNEKDANEPFTEEHPVAPLGVYGKTKYLGEQYLKEILPEEHIVVRTSWLHGVHGPNFLATMLRLGRELEELKVVNDQIGSPTYALWLAEVMLKLVSKDVRGTFHASSRGGISWYDFAKEIFEQAQIEVNLESQTTQESGRLAPRPAYSTFDVSKLETALGQQCPNWKTGIREHLKQLKEV